MYLVAILKKLRNCHGIRHEASVYSMATYNVSIKACRSKDLILGDSIKNGDPSKEGIWEVWENGG